MAQTLKQDFNSIELALKSKLAKLQDEVTDAHLLLDRVVLPDIGLDLLDNWPILNLSECLGITDGSLSSRGGGCLQSAHKLFSRGKRRRLPSAARECRHQQCSAQKGDADAAVV